MSISAANGAHVLVVLVVEDEYFVRFNIATCLRDVGYVVIETCMGGSSFCGPVFVERHLLGSWIRLNVGPCRRGVWFAFLRLIRHHCFHHELSCDCDGSGKRDSNVLVFMGGGAVRAQAFGKVFT